METKFSGQQNIVETGKNKTGYKKFVAKHSGTLL